MKKILVLPFICLLTFGAFAGEETEFPEQMPALTTPAPVTQSEPVVSSGKEPYRVTSSEKHEMRVLNSGLGSLYARVDMIRRAKKSVDMEAYIFNPDTAGRVILKELADAAKRGVKVRILVDKWKGVFKMDEHIARELKKSGIEIRYYNPAPLINLASLQFRNHRKLLVRDGEEALTGGRNIADEYFDLSHKFNFLDRDLTVEGEVVKSMAKTFDNFWDARLVEVPKEPEVPKEDTHGEDGDSLYQQRVFDYERKEKFAKGILAPNEEVERVLKIVDTKGKESFLRREKRVCPEVSFASDKEGASFKESLNKEKYKEEYRLLSQEIAKWMDDKSEGEFIIDTPYFLSSPLSAKIKKMLAERKVKIKIFTNSLASTDAIHVSSVFSDYVTEYSPNEGFKAFIYRGKYSGEEPLHDEALKNATWGTHSKTMVFSDKAFMVGSYNVDNRSSYYNTELAVFCNGSPELTKDVKDNIQKRMNNSFKLDTNGDAEDCEDPKKDVSALKQLMYYLVKIPSHLFQDFF